MWGVELQVGEGVLLPLLLCLVPRKDIHERGRIARPAALNCFSERYMCKI